MIPIRTGTEASGESGAVLGERSDEIRFENIEMSGPSEMAEVPDDLGAGAASGPHERQDTREIVLTTNRFDEMPADAFARDADSLAAQAQVILPREAIVGGGGDEIDALAGAADEGRAFEAAREESFEQFARQGFGCPA